MDFISFFFFLFAYNKVRGNGAKVRLGCAGLVVWAPIVKESCFGGNEQLKLVEV